MRTFRNLFICAVMMVLSVSCDGFLEVKPNARMVVPGTLEDCALLLYDYTTMNCSYPSLGEVSADDYFLPFENWEAVSITDEKNAYVWLDEAPVLNNQWQGAYKVVFTANQVLDVIKGIPLATDQDLYDRVKGAAHFYRAFAFHQLLSTYAQAYTKETASSKPGIPIRLSPDLDEKTERATLAECYEQMERDYQTAVRYLPSFNPMKGQPAKAAAYAGLSRMYLEQQTYDKAMVYADSSLQLQKGLLDYNTLNSWAGAPIPEFNVEVLFSASSIFTMALIQGNARVDSILYDSYESIDLRKQVYFNPNYELPTVSYDIKATYDRTQAGIFVGLTVSEVLLIKAESATRLGQYDKALQAINLLRKNRIIKDKYTDVSITDDPALLTFILDERRKELVFRGLRWADLKRLNQNKSTERVLHRKLGDQAYTLSPNSLSYALLIPQDVISESGIEQNKR